MAVPRYYLSPDAFACSTKRHWLILDAAFDKYLSIDKADFEHLGPWVHGWMPSSNQISPAEMGSTAAKLAEDLLTRGIITEDPSRAKPLAAPELSPPRVSVHSVPAPLPTGTDIRYLPSFLLTSRIAARWLDQIPLGSILKRVSQRRLSHPTSAESSYSARTVRLVAAFNVWRLFYAREYLCLFDSLALIEFLSWHDVFPNWVFGVTVDPFEAHCWVQTGDVVLNDTLTKVSPFTPIMCV